MAELQKSCFKASSLLSVSVVVLVLWLSIPARTSMAAPEKVRVGVILDRNSTLGRMLYNSLALAVEDYYELDHKDAKTKIDLVVRNVSLNDVVAAADAASDLIEKENVSAILGPQNPEQARYVVELGQKFQKPVIWFPITGPSLLPPPSPSSIYSHQGLNCFQFQAIADIIKALGWQSIVPIYEDTEYGSQLIPCLANVLKDMGIRMANVTAIDSDSTESQINSTLVTLNNMRTHVFLVHLSMDLGTKFIHSAQENKMMDEGYAWILTQELSSLTDPKVEVERRLYHSNNNYTYFTDYFRLKSYMQGALGVRPMDSTNTGWRRAKETNFSHKFRSTQAIYGWWAYHTLEALAMAVEKLGTDSSGEKLVEQIQATDLSWRSGLNFSLKSGRLDQSKLEVYNVIGARERIIASWSPENRLVQNDSNPVKTSDEYLLKGPLWPGDTLDKPPKLRIGVPTTNSTPELLNVDIYNSSEPHIYGFAITVFLKAVDVLPFPLNYKFVPLPNQRRNDAPTYDDILCNQIKDQDLDAVIGDITIVSSRTKFVDFTLPYLDSSVAMVVRVKKVSTSRWIFFKPFKRSLWLILGTIFLITTITIVALESFKSSKPEKTEEFIDNPLLVYKIDVMENFDSRAARWLVIMTSFLFVLVLQVYTANLTSILTQGKEKEPSFKDESELQSSNLSVGYRNGSWVREFLIDQVRFNSSQLKAYTSREEYNDSLSIGTRNGGVDAIFDETPYLELFLSKYKSRFMMSGPKYKTGGFAFAFPKKGSLVSYFSNATLNVTQDAESYRVLMAKSSLTTSIEDLEFKDENDIETSSLGISNFGGLYPMALFLGLAILYSWMIERLRQKVAFPIKAKA